MTIATTTTQTLMTQILIGSFADEIQAERVIASVDASQFMQTLKYMGKQTTLYYKDPKLQKFNDVLAMKIFQVENPGVDIEQIRHTEEEFALLKS